MPVLPLRDFRYAVNHPRNIKLQQFERCGNGNVALRHGKRKCVALACDNRHVVLAHENGQFIQIVSGAGCYGQCNCRARFKPGRSRISFGFRGYGAVDNIFHRHVVGEVPEHRLPVAVQLNAVIRVITCEMRGNAVAGKVFGEDDRFGSGWRDFCGDADGGAGQITAGVNVAAFLQIKVILNFCIVAPARIACHHHFTGNVQFGVR